MRTGRLFIDGRDAFAEFGLFVAEGGYRELVAYPPLKAVESNDWQEEDGIEADLSSPVPDSREFSVKFALSGARCRLGAFTELLSGEAYHTFRFEEIGRTCRLRMVSYTNLDTAAYLGFVTVRFADDFPMDSYTYAAPASTVPAYDDYAIDGRRFTDYGVRVLAGTLAEVEKSPAVKQNLLRNLAAQHGAVYDGARVTFRSKEVKVKCLLRAETLAELWRNYDALLFDLLRPGERLLYADATGEEYPCHYKSCSVTEFYPDGKIWLAFTLTLVFTSYRLHGEEFVLSSEDNELMMTEQDENAINLSSYGN